MRSPAELRAEILSALSPMPPREVGLGEAEGCVLAEDVVSTLSLPPFDNSAMDGYAVRAEDVTNTPVTLSVLGDIAAGAPSSLTVTPGATLRIMTGAPMPAGADAVVKVELTDGGAEVVEIREGVSVGANVRPAGDDIVAGQTVLRAGTVLGARQIGMLAAVGRANVLVHPQPFVIVIPTGSELLEPGQEPRPGAIYDSNGPMLAAAVRATGARVEVRSAVVDEDAAFGAVIDEAAARADLIVTTGGVSMGVYDTAKAVLSARGTVNFEKIAMNPGMPQGFGTVSGTPIITLPGNPVSSFISFEVFVRPAIRAMQGRHEVERTTRRAVCTTAFSSPKEKVQFARGVLSGTDELSVEPIGSQGSHIMGGLAAANAIIVVPVGQDAVSAGESVDVIDLREDS